MSAPFFGYSWETGMQKQVAFKVTDGHIFQLFVSLPGDWKYSDLTSMANAPAASVMVNGYSWEDVARRQVVFITENSHIHELSTASSGEEWEDTDLTTTTGAPIGNYVANGYSWEGGQSKQVVFTTSDGHIHELYLTEGYHWQHADLTEITDAPAAYYVVNGYSWESGKSKQVVFATPDGHIHELYLTEGYHWQHADLTAITGAPVANRVANGYSWESGKSKQVVYTTGDGHIHELYITLEEQKWHYADLTAITDAPVASYVANGYSWESAKSKQVVFTTADGHIHELYITLAEQKWHHADLTDLSGAPVASYVGNGYGWESGKSKQVVFTIGDNHIHELFINLAGGGWQAADLTAIAGAPPIPPI